MKHVIYAAVLTAFIASSAAVQSSAQQYEPAPVTISKEKVKIDGTVCYSHVVLERQTLYSICKAYGVTADDLYKFNPTLKENGLKKNSILIIPASAVTAHEKNASRQEETVTNTTIGEPSKSAQDQSFDEVDSQNGKDGVKVHTVKWFEDIDMIADRYGVGAEAIMKANGLTGRKLKNRQKLIIPSQGAFADEREPEEVHFAGSEVTTDNTGNDDEVKQMTFKPFVFRAQPVELGLMLPLKADGIAGSRNPMDFYAGVLLAVRDLAVEGISVNLNVYDTASDDQAWEKKALGSDLVIGPIYYNDLAAVLQKEYVPIVSPLDPRAEALAAAHRNFIQIPTPHLTQYLNLAGWISEDLKGNDKLIVISEKGSRDAALVSTIRSALDSTHLTYAPFSYSILEGRNILTSLSNLMTDTGENRFVVASESEAFVNDVVRNLNLLIHSKYAVTLYAPAKIRTFETIEAENLHNTNLHVCHSYSIDYESAKVRKFLLEFRALFNTEPSQYAFQGYDVTNYCIRMYSCYGSSWTDMLDSNDMQMLQSSFKFRRAGNGGWVNEGVRRIEYKDNWRVVQY